MFRILPLLGLAGILTAAPALAQNDECTTASVIPLGATAFDTSLATLSAEVWPCAGGGGPDLWYEYTAPNTNAIRFDTCGTTYDTALEGFSGTCGALVSIVCNDDDCGLQSSITLTPAATGDVFYVRVGGFAGNTGAGTLTVFEFPPPVQGCVTNSGFETGDLSGWSVVDHPAPFQPVVVAPAGTTQAFGIFTITPTEGNFALQAGFDAGGPSTATISQDVQVDAGLSPLTFDYRIGWDYTLGPLPTAPRTLDFVVRPVGGGAALQTTNVFTADIATLTNLDTGPLSAMIDLSMFIGQTVQIGFEINIPEAFTGPGFLQIDNVSCPAGNVIGTNYCGPAPANSTGNSAVMSATGSTAVSVNALTLVATDLPANSFGFFLASLTQGFVGNPGGSMGNLCLGGSIGRYVGPGQIQNSGSAQEISLLLDLTMTPTPTGLVSIAAGEVWNFQAWYRDAVGGVATSNFTDGLEITFL